MRKRGEQVGGRPRQTCPETGNRLLTPLHRMDEWHPFARLLFWFVLLAATVGGLLWIGHFNLAALWSDTREFYADTRQAVKTAGPWGPVVSVLLMAVHGVVPIPTTPIAFAQAAIFGILPGILYTFAGLMSASYVGFYVARWVGRPYVHRWVKAEYLQRLHGWVRRFGITGVIVVRILPIPLDVVSYVAGLSDMDPGSFGLGTAIGIIPGMTMVYLLVAGLRHRAFLFYTLGGIALLLLFTVAVGVWVRRERRL